MVTFNFGTSDAATMPPLRVAHVITRLINGGADENTVISCNHAARAGHDVTLVHGAHTHPEIMAKVDRRVQLIAVPNLVRPIRPFLDAKAFRDLTRLFHKLKPNIVHTHTSKAGILGRFAARAARVPKIVHGVHIAPFTNVSLIERLIYLAAEKATAGMTDAFIDVSQGMKDAYVHAGLGDSDRHHVIPSGFDLQCFRSAKPPEGWRALLRLAPDAARPRVLLMIAAFESRKRHLEFLKEFPRVVFRFPDVRLLFAGDGKLRGQIEAEIAQLGLTRNVILTGFRDDPERLIALADICLIASKREGLPRVVMQYLAGGKPCIACELPGIREVLRHEENGIVIPPGDMERVVEAIIALLENNERCAQLAAGARATDLSGWEAAHMGERIETVYRHIMHEQPRDLPRSSKGVIAP